MIAEYKAARGCRDCGERDPVVLDLHHHDANKNPRLGFRRGWSKLPLRQLSVMDLMREMMKCTVLCANDHRREHACG